MQRASRAPLLVLSILIGCLSPILESRAEDRDEGLVDVEPNFTQIVGEACERIAPYQQRRGRLGSYGSLGYSWVSFDNYQPQFSADSFGDAYGRGNMLDISLGIKINWPAISIGFEAGLGNYATSSSASALVPSELNLTQLRLGGRVIADGLFAEPWVAPYACAGLYVMRFSETASGVGFDGNTSPAAYFCGGALFQINWIEPETSIIAYNEQGLENTFVFLEARMLASSEFEDDSNVDFGTSPFLTVGLNLEF
jgi:hypothetical protein